MSESSNPSACSQPGSRRNPLWLALTLPAAILLAGLVLPASAWAQNCGRPAIFWNAGSGLFNDKNNFTGSDLETGCEPLPTDNVTFGGTGFPQAGGIVTFPGSQTVNFLDAASNGWTFSLSAPITSTTGLGFGLVSLTLEGGNVLSASPTGTISGGTLVIPDDSGVTAGIFKVSSLVMTGGGNATVLGGATGSGANLDSVSLGNGSSIDLFGNGPHASFVNIGSGTINDSQVSVSGSALNNVLWLAGENNNSTLTVNGGSVLSTQQLYVSSATNSTVTVTGAGTRVSAGLTNVYGQLTVANDATLATGPFNLLTGAGGALTVQSGAQVTSSSATVTGGLASGPTGFDIIGQHSIWTVNGPLSISNTAGTLSAGARLQVLGGDLTLSSSLSPLLPSSLTVTGSNTLLDVSGNVTVANSGASSLSFRAGGTGEIGGNLVIANQALGFGTVSLDGAGTQLTVTGGVTVGQAGVGTLSLTNGATLDPPNVVIGAIAPANAGDPDPVTGLHTADVSTVTVSTGAQLTTDDLTVGKSGYGALMINDGTVITDGTSSLASETGGEGNVILDDPAASWQANDITVGDAGKGLLQINSGTVTTSGDVTVGGQAGSKGTLAITAGRLAVGGNLTVSSEGSGSFSEEPTGTLTVAGETIIGDQFATSGKMTLDGAFSLAGTVIVGEFGSGSLLVQLGASNSGGGASVTTPQVILGDQEHANGSMTVDGSGTAFETSSLTVGSFGMGKVTLSNGALLISNGPVRVADQASTLIDAVTVGSLAKLNVNSTLAVGSVGIGTLTLTTGGKVTSIGDLTLGEAPGSSGLATVSGVQTGIASTVNYQSALIVGHDGTGELTVSGGGLVAPTASGSGAVEVGADAGGTGTVSISGVDSGSGLSARLFASNLSVGGTSLAAGGTGKITVGTGGVLDVSKTLTVWSHGTVAVTGSGAVTVGTGPAAAAGTVRVDSGGTLRGPGTIKGNLVNAGGRVSPGDPVTLTVDGNYFQTGGVLDLQIAGTGPGEADLLAATGDVQITGGVVDLEFINGYAPTTGAQFTLFSAADVSVSNDLFEVDGGAATFDFTTSFDPTDGAYELTDTGPIGSTVPEPPPWALTLLGFGLLGLVRRRTNPRAPAQSRVN